MVSRESRNSDKGESDVGGLPRRNDGLRRKEVRHACDHDVRQLEIDAPDGVAALDLEHRLRSVGPTAAVRGPCWFFSLDVEIDGVCDRGIG
jgi:hypothetical protein